MGVTTAYLALGANLGDRQASLIGARKALHLSPGIEVIESSGLYETSPVGGPQGQASYFNAVLKIETSLSANILLQYCLKVEDIFGRKRFDRWGPRTLDIDLLFYGAEVSHSKELELPHPRLHERTFVLAPLMDVAPEMVHPLLGLTIRELFHNSLQGNKVKLLCQTW